MGRYFLHIAYNGSNYRGWQRQVDDVVTIQEVIEQKLAELFKKNIRIMGCGRTDAGVHARQYFLHFDLDELPHEDSIFRLNKMLPNDITAKQLIPVAPNDHTQWDATVRTYHYHIHFYKDPFLTNVSAYYDLKMIHYEAMEEAVELLRKAKDFRAFCKKPDIYKHTNCRIDHISLEFNQEKTKMCLIISANRFLRSMMRLIMIRLLEIGQGKTTLETFKYHLEEKQAFKYMIPAYPQGLYLYEVAYPYLKEVNGIIQYIKEE